MAPASFACCYCGKPGVSRTIQGLRSHISQTPGCRTRRDKEHSLLNHNRNARAGLQHAHQQSTENPTQQENPEEINTPPSNNADDHRSKRARVDDDDDDENFRSAANTNFIVDYPAEARAGAIFEDSQDGLQTRFEKIRCSQQRAGSPAWAPFDSLADWELSRWLIQSGVSQREIDKFLKLESVRTDIRYVFCDAESPPRFSPVLAHPHEINTHSSSELTVSQRAQSGHVKSSRSKETTRMRTAMPLSRKSSSGDGTQSNVSES